MGARREALLAERYRSSGRHEKWRVLDEPGLCGGRRSPPEYRLLLAIRRQVSSRTRLADPPPGFGEIDMVSHGGSRLVHPDADHVGQCRWRGRSASVMQPDGFAMDDYDHQ